MAEAQLDLLAPHEPDSHFVIRPSPRARHMAIHVGADGVVEVVVPRHTRPGAVEKFVTQHRQWIDRALGELEKDHPPIDRSMPDVIELPALAASWSVQYASRRLREAGGTLQVPAVHEDRPACRQYLQRWLKGKARRCLVPKLQQLAEDRDLPFKRVQVRGQRTRWGSYSSSGTISINYCLLFLAPELVQHLMLHELCHTVEMNHSRRFWRLLAQHQTAFLSLERRLDKAWIDVPGWVGLH
ncbi:MAG: M48 family metallopeptidase [Gammaproteobacteria bacterium]|nr:M48 family metallopeptidase [Gammaproteobacteria bacterium]